jgi:cyclophilin family peptidyl-prolyl cis-trans isomerase
VWILLSQVKLVCQIKTMKKLISIALSITIVFGATGSVLAQNKPVAKTEPSPAEIVAAAPADEWTAIAPSDLLVMDLVPDTKGKPRRVVIQLMPPPFSQGWVGNIRKLAAAKFWDGTSINRVQDNYVTQWGDATEKKPLPAGLAVMPESAYENPMTSQRYELGSSCHVAGGSYDKPSFWWGLDREQDPYVNERKEFPEPKVAGPFFSNGWPFVGVVNKDAPEIKFERKRHLQGAGCQDRVIGEVGVVGSHWPVHCYAMVGVGRSLSPDTGTGAELYTVIGHAPRHLDRNIALVGRVIEGMEHLSSLPRGTGALGFYEKPEERTTILSVRLMSEMPSDKSLPQYEYLSTESMSFSNYVDARANRRDPFFIKPAGGADICNIPVPVRRVKQAER